MKTINTYLITLLTAALLVATVLTGCKDRESIAHTEGRANEPPAIPVTVVQIKPVACMPILQGAAWSRLLKTQASHCP